MKYKTVRVTDHQATGWYWCKRRQGLGMPLHMLARRLGCSMTYLHDLEHGNRNWNEEREGRYREGLIAWAQQKLAILKAEVEEMRRSLDA